jgi:hypothetical protein
LSVCLRLFASVCVCCVCLLLFSTFFVSCLSLWCICLLVCRFFQHALSDVCLSVVLVSGCSLLYSLCQLFSFWCVCLPVYRCIFALTVCLSVVFVCLPPLPDFHLFHRLFLKNQFWIYSLVYSPSPSPTPSTPQKPGLT